MHERRAAAASSSRSRPPRPGALCSVWEGRLEPQSVGAGLHLHHTRDESFCVLQGELVLRVGAEECTAVAGTFAFVPRETVHGFRNASDNPATILITHYPAGFEHFLVEVQRLAARQAPREEFAALAARFDLVSVDESAGS